MQVWGDFVTCSCWSKLGVKVFMIAGILCVCVCVFIVPMYVCVCLCGVCSFIAPVYVHVCACRHVGRACIFV